MKINEVINEGMLDWAKKIGGGVQGAIRGVQAARAQRAGADRIDHTAKELFRLWNQELASQPGTTPAQQAQLLVQFANQQFHDKPGTKIPNPVAADAKSSYDYLAKRTQEYFATVSQQAATAPDQKSQLRTGYAFPKSDADITIQGYTYGFDIKNRTWYDEESGQEITNPKDIQLLNKKYYDLKLASGGGTVPNPDVANDQSEFDFKGTNVRNLFDPKLNEGVETVVEGGNAIKSSEPVKKEDVRGVVESAKKLLPAELQSGIQTDIGSAGYKVQSGDIDVMVEAEEVVKFFNTEQAKDPVKDAKQLLKVYFEKQGVEAVVNGRNVSVGIKYKEQTTGQPRTAQVDVMVIHEAGIVAPWHQHGLRGMYSDPEFKGSDIFMLISSIAKHLGLKFDAFGAKLLRRDNNEVVARTRKEVAKVLLNPKAKEDDLNSVKTILKALENDPDREGKLAQARQDAAKGLMRLPETANPGTAAWFRQLSDTVK